MTAAGPSTWARTIFTAAVSMLLLVIGPELASADPQSGPTSIAVAAQVAGDFRVTATGTLSDSGGNPVPGATVQGRVDGGPVTDATTGTDGVYQLNFTLPEALRTGEHQLMVIFAGQGTLDASQAAVSLSADTEPPPPVASAEPTRLDVFLDVSIAPTTVIAGGLVTIEGAITDSSRNPIQGALISVLIDGRESKDSRTISSASGTFQTFAEIAPSSPTGKGSLVVSFAGDAAFTPGIREFALNVDDAPVVDETTPEESAKESPAASVTAEAEGTDIATVTAPANSTTEPTVLRSPLSWFYVALIVVGGAAALVAAALVFRGTYGRRAASSREERSLDLLLEPEPGNDPDSDGLSGLFAEDAEDAAVAPDDTEDAPKNTEQTQEFPTPRRSLD